MKKVTLRLERGITPLTIHGFEDVIRRELGQGGYTFQADGDRPLLFNNSRMAEVWLTAHNKEVVKDLLDCGRVSLVDADEDILIPDEDKKDVIPNIRHQASLVFKDAIRDEQSRKALERRKKNEALALARRKGLSAVKEDVTGGQLKEKANRSRTQRDDNASKAKREAAAEAKARAEAEAKANAEASNEKQSSLPDGLKD